MKEALPDKKDKKGKKKEDGKQKLVDEGNCVNKRYAISEWRQMWIVLKRALLFSRRDWVIIFFCCLHQLYIPFIEYLLTCFYYRRSCIYVCLLTFWLDFSSVLFIMT